MLEYILQGDYWPQGDGLIGEFQREVMRVYPDIAQTARSRRRGEPAAWTAAAANWWEFCGGAPIRCSRWRAGAVPGTAFCR